MAILNKDETSNIYKKINKVSFHLANNTQNVENLDGAIQKKAYYSIQKGLRTAFIKYDRESKLATLLKKEDLLDKYSAMKNTPKTLWNDAPTAKGTKSSSKKVVASKKI